MTKLFCGVRLIFLSFFLSLTWWPYDVGAATDVKSRIVTIEDTVNSGDSPAQFKSTTNSLAGPKISSINDTVFQWWYFSGISNDASISVVAIFFTTTPGGFPLTDWPNVTSINIQVYGKSPPHELGVFVIPADSATFKYGANYGQGISATYTGPSVNASFTISPTLNKAYLVIEGVATDGTQISATMSLLSTAPGHYPCSPSIGSGHSLEVFPHLGATNAMPSALVNASFLINDIDYSVANGSGYADQNWGDAPFAELISSWYWGRALVGPYSIVWFDGIDGNGKEHVGGYVAENGQTLTSTCKAGSVKVRPVGAGSTWPPTPSKYRFNHLALTFNLDGGEVLAINVTHSAEVVAAKGFYHRWIGMAQGGLVGGEVYSGGPAEFEEFTVD